MKKTFEVYENDAGLYLCVLEDGECVHIVENWEWEPEGALKDALDELMVDENAYMDWDGDLVKHLKLEGMEDVTAASLYQEGLGTLIVESGEDGGYDINIDALGAHGEWALGIDDK